MPKANRKLQDRTNNKHIRHLQASLRMLGYAIDDADGTFGASTRQAVEAFQRDRQLPVTGKPDPDTIDTIGVAIETLPDRPEPAPGPNGDQPTPQAPQEKTLFEVRGEVVRPDGSPLQDTLVRAFDRALGNWRPLGEARTNDRGHYQITYDPEVLRTWGKTRADLKVEVTGGKTGSTVLAASPLILQALPREVVDFSIGQGDYHGPDEYTLVDKAIGPLLQSAGDLGSLGMADVIILARECKLPSGSVACYVKAQRWAAAMEISPAVFYGLLRQRQPTRLDALLARPFRRLWNALERAQAQNTISVTLDSALRTDLAEIQQTYLSRPNHPFRQLLQTTTLSGEHQSLFTRRLTTAAVTGDAFWQSLETDDGFTAKEVTDLKATLELQSLTDNNASLSTQLRSRFQVQQPREAAAFSIDKWRDEVLAADGVEIPDEILPGEPEPMRKEAYARMLYRTAELRYPTASLAGQMSRSQEWADRPLSAFMAAHPDFEFTGQRVATLLQHNPEALNLFPDPATGRQELLSWEQLFHLTPAEDKLGAIQPLWDAGLRSARQIAVGGRQQLLRKVGSRLAKPVANRIYHQSVHNTGVALNVYLKYHQGLNGQPLYAMRTASELPAQVDDVADTALDWWDGLLDTDTSLPEWSELFGTADACECEHCQSAFSASAYLVDMMYFLQRAADGAGKNALDYLLERRPDLGTLQLTCENTETLMPQIDLVIEILEQIVAHSTDGTSIPAGSIGQTTWESEQLDALPEHLDPAAYEKLRETDFPFNRLPFDLWLEEGRRYLQQMGVARDDLMRVMPPKGSSGLKQIAGETLGMSTREREIIETPKTKAASLAVYWGVDTGNGDLQKQLGQVEALMKQAHIDYESVVRLLNTRYVNPGRLISVKLAGESCSLDGAKFAGPDGDTISQEDFRSFLDRLHRFLRLQQRLGWDVYELDRVIHALGVTDFNQRNFMASLADVKRLRDTLRLPVADLCTWWSSLDTYVFEEDGLSQYEEIFLDPAVFPDTHAGTGPDLRNEVFALRADRLDLAVTLSSTLSGWLAESDGSAEPVYWLHGDYSAYVQSATRLTAEDVLLLAGEVLIKDTATGSVPLNLANVSMLYRIGSYTRALHISIQDYLYLVRLLGRSPLSMANDGVGPLETMAVYERFTEIEAGDWSLEELAYLLLDDDAAAAAFDPTVEAVDSLLGDLSLGLVGVDSVGTARANPDLLTSLSQSLGASLALDATMLQDLLFTYRTTMGDELLAQLIAAANPSFPAPATPFADTYKTLHKFAMAWNGLGLDATHLAFVASQALGWLDVASLPLTEQSSTDFEAWRRLAQAAAVQLSVFTTEQSVFGLLDSAKDTALSREDFLAQASTWSGWSLEDLTYLTGPDGFEYLYPDAFLDEQWLLALDKVFSVIRSLGVSAAQAHTWAGAELTFAETESIKQALILAYNREQFLEVMAGIQDELRVLKRDALLGCLLANFSTDDPYEVYRHYLIDPEMDPCASTSRMVQAHATTQLFAQRILLNLEPPLSFPREDAEAWQWRKNYRIWEAARKVFLYPENWIEPELRDNKSVFFKELEDGLLQNEVTFETAERLYHEYLVKLNQVSRLEIMGMYQDEQTDILHVFGRTPDVPPVYYYRRWEDKARWTPWERVDLDIQGNHLIPMVYNGQLYLFWPEFKFTENIPDTADVDQVIDELTRRVGDIERALEEQRHVWEEDLGLDLDDHPLSLYLDDYLRPQLTEAEAERQAILDATEKYTVELGMNWSGYDVGRWQTKRLSREKAHYQNETSAFTHHFLGWVSSSNKLYISAHSRTDYIQAYTEDATVATFMLDSCQGEVVTTAGVSAPVGEVTVVDSYTSFNHRLVTSLLSRTELALEVAGEGSDELRDILSSISSAPLRVDYAHQYGFGGNQSSPFFFSEDDCIYFAQLGNTISRTWDQLSGSVGAAGLPAARAALPSMAAGQQTQPAGSHIGGISDGIISRDTSHTGMVFSAQETDTLVGILAEDGAAEAIPMTTGVIDTSHTWGEKRYRFTRFYHPYTCLFLEQLSRYGIDGLLNPDPEWGAESENLYRQLTPLETFDFETIYQPDEWVADAYPVEEIDFDHASPYGSYNWELFFHIPLLIATRLMQNQRFAEARRWFNTIFDPMNVDGQAPARFWKIKPFYEEQLKGPTDTLQELMDLLEQGSYQLEQQVDEWETNPFNPHAVARLRMAVYMKTTVMKVLDCLIAEADQLFTLDTRETVNEAAQIYLLAADILGQKPALLPAQETEVLTANSLLGRIGIDFDWSEWNPLDTLTSLLPTKLSGGGFSRASQVILADTSINAQGATTSYDTLFLFCIPHNEKLYDYWDTVADRLFKIRHCMNIAGLERQLALFAPPIDPGLLVRAGAAGLDIAAVLSSLYQPLPHYRFSAMLQKALEFCGEVRSLGGELLSALEKKDAEAMSRLRSSHEVALLKAVRDVKKKSVEEATESLAGLQKSRALAEHRAEYYAGRGVNRSEEDYLNQLNKAHDIQQTSQGINALASTLYLIPDIEAGMPPKTLFGGTYLGNAQSAFGAAMGYFSGQHLNKATRAEITAQREHRQNDWTFQAEQARKEIEQLDKQILAAEIRQQIADKDLENQEKQIAQAEEVDVFMKAKFSNQELYSWMITRLSTLHFQAYQLAYQLAKKVEKTFQYELAPEQESSTYIQPMYWDSLKKGLLAGEQLSLDLKRLDAAYLEQNKREYELVRHISLRQLNPQALLALKATGACEVTLPEWLFDLDNPGHYMRRLKNVSLSIPSVTGPYTSVNCTLSLLGSTVRKSSLLDNDEYARQGSEDSRFTDTFGTIQSIVTSSGNADSGLFETNLRDERYLPFEGAGAESTWRLELPAAFRQFDYNTISDVILHVRYTARPGGSVLAGKAIEYLQELLEEASSSGLSLLLSLRHDFSAEWLRFLSGDSAFSATVKRDYFPYFTQGKAISINAVQLYSIREGQLETLTPEGLDPVALTDALQENGAFELLLAPDDAILVQDTQAYVFMLIGYSVALTG